MPLQYKNNFTSTGLLQRSAKNFLSFCSLDRTNYPRETILTPSPLCSLNIRDCLTRPTLIIPISFPLSISQLFRDHGASRSIFKAVTILLTTLTKFYIYIIYILYPSFSPLSLFQSFVKFSRGSFSVDEFGVHSRDGKLHDRNISFDLDAETPWKTLTSYCWAARTYTYVRTRSRAFRVST